MKIEHFVKVEAEVKMVMTLEEAKALALFLEGSIRSYNRAKEKTAELEVGKQAAKDLQLSLAELPERLASE